MTDNDRHPDLVAYLYGQLDEAETSAAQAHLKDCSQCQKEIKQLQETLEIVDRMARRVKRAFPDPRQLAQVLDETLGPMPGAQLEDEDEDEVVLSKQELAQPLPPELRSLLVDEAASEVDQRLRRSLEVITGKGRDQVSEMARSILSGEADDLRLAAIRDDATQDDEDAPLREPGQDSGAKPDKES